MAAGLVRGEGFAVDASVIEADASRFKRIEGATIDWTDEERARRPIREYLEALDGVNAPTNPARAPRLCRRPIPVPRGQRGAATR